MLSPARSASPAAARSRRVAAAAPMPPEPPPHWWERCTLPANAWVGVPISFMEILVMITPSSSLPTMLLDFFHQSTPLAAISTGVVDSIGGTAAFLLSPTFGRWSDVYGRKSMLLFLSALTFLPIFCLSFYPYLSLWAYLSLRGLGKLSAFGILFSCVSDVVAPEQRGRLFGQTSGLGMAAMVAGPLLSLELSTNQSFRICGGLAVATLLYIACLMPETLWIGLRRKEAVDDQLAELSYAQGTESSAADSAPGRSAVEATVHTALLSAPHYASERTLDRNNEDAHVPAYPSIPPTLSVCLPSAPVDLGVDSASAAAEAVDPAHPRGASSRSNPCVALRQAFSSPSLRHIALVIFFSQLSQNGVQECANLYLKTHLAFTRDDNSRLLIAMGSWAVCVMVLIMPLLLRRFREKKVLCLALALDLVHQFLYLLIPNKKWGYSIAAAQGLGFMAFPASNAVLANVVSNAEQGAVLAMSAGIRSLTQGVAPVLFNGLLAFWTWDRAPAYFPQAPFCVSAVCTAISLALAIKLPPTRTREERLAEAQAQAQKRAQASPSDGETSISVTGDNPYVALEHTVQA